MEITVDLIKQYIHQQRRHKAYNDTVKIMERLKTHADGKMPKDLIDKRRPNEDPENQQYRKDIFVPITKDVIARIVNALGKIRKSQDWSVKYPTDKLSNKIEKPDSLQEYFEKKFPFFDDVVNWLFNVALRTYLIDPNSIVVVMPLEMTSKDTDLLRPYPFMYFSDQVLDYQEGKYCVIHSTDKATYKDGDQTYHDGGVYYFITDEYIQRYEQKNIAKDYQLVSDYKHKLGRMPAFKTGGVIVEAMDKDFIFESRIDAIYPSLTEAAREYNDLQIDVVLNVHTEKWEWAFKDCQRCSGSGKVLREGKSVTCPKCKGEQKDVSSPFTRKILRAAKTNEQPAPIPPAGYIMKDTALIEIMDRRFEKHKTNAYKAVNMQFLDEVGANQSGIAKAEDKDETNSFYNTVAEDIVRILYKVIFFGNEYRYGVLLNEKERTEQLPSIAVPDRYDVLPANYLIEEIKKARDSKASPILINALEAQYAIKKFANEPEVKNQLTLTMLLDPFPGIPQEEKDSRLMNGGITEKDYVISCYIYSFVRRALEENANFATLSIKEKQVVIEKLADEKIKQISAKEAIMSVLDKKNQSLNPEEDQAA